MSVKCETCFLSDIIILGKNGRERISNIPILLLWFMGERNLHLSSHSLMFMMELIPFTETNRYPKVNPGQSLQGQAWSRWELAYPDMRRTLSCLVRVSTHEVPNHVCSFLDVSLTFCGCLLPIFSTLPGTGTSAQYVFELN